MPYFQLVRWKDVYKRQLYSHEQTLMEPSTSPMHYLMIREDWANHIPPLRIPVTKCDTIEEMVILGREDTQLLEVFSKDGKPLPAEWAERIHAQGNFHIAEPNQGCYHVSFAGASKLKAAQALARQLRLQPEEVMCLGAVSYTHLASMGLLAQQHTLY